MAVTSAPIQARMSTESREWLPRKRIGRTTRRLISAITTPVSTRVAKRSCMNASTPESGTSSKWKPSHSASTIAWRIAVRRTTKPQKMSACMIPLYGQRSSRAWART